MEQGQLTEVSERTHAEATLPAIRSILVFQRADDFVLDVRGGEGAYQGRLRWHWVGANARQVQAALRVCSIERNCV